MDDLAARLKNVGGAGVFRLNCELQDLRAAVAAAGYTLLAADLSAVHGKGECLATLAQAIKAPEWFGNNWDALADALCDLSWQPAPGYVLLLRNGGDMLGLSAGEHATALEIFGAAVACWKSQGKSFWVFFC